MQIKKIVLGSLLALLPLFSGSTASAEVDEWGINHSYVREDGVEFEYSYMSSQTMKGFSISDIIANDSHSNIVYMKYEAIWQGAPKGENDFNETFENHYTGDYAPFRPGEWQGYSESTSVDPKSNPLPSPSQYRYRITVTLDNGKQFVSNWERRYDTNFVIRDNGIVPVHEYDKSSHLFPETDWSKYFQNVERVVYE